MWHEHFVQRQTSQLEQNNPIVLTESAFRGRSYSRVTKVSNPFIQSDSVRALLDKTFKTNCIRHIAVLVARLLLAGERPCHPTVCNIPESFRLSCMNQSRASSIMSNHRALSPSRCRDNACSVSCKVEGCVLCER